MPMRQLRACDFCGDDAAGVYEVLPPELSPTEAEQRRVVLCVDCLETLETVVDPLLDRLGIDGDADAEPTAKSTSPADASSTEPTPPADASSAEPTARAEETPRADERSHADETSPPACADPGDSDASTTADSSRRSSGSERTSAFNAPEGFTDIAESDEIDLDGSPDGSPSDSDANGVADASPVSGSPDSRDGTRREESAGDTSEDSIDAEDTASPDAPDRETPDASGRGDTLGSDRNAVGAEPDEFRTVMRLLGNREFPIGRSEVVDLAAGAYDLDETHVERIVDHAIDRGVLADEDGTLRRS